MALDVPPNWNVEQTEDGLIQLTPPHGEAAAHIRLLRRTRRRRPTMAEAVEMAAAFVEQVGRLDGTVEERSGDGRLIAVCAARGDEYRCWIEAHVSRKKAVVCTVVFTDETLDVASEARGMFATLTLLD